MILTETQIKASLNYHGLTWTYDNNKKCYVALSLDPSVEGFHPIKTKLDLIKVLGNS